MKNNNNIVLKKSYCNALQYKPLILKENKAKSGIYRWNNLINNKSYIGSSVNLVRRFNVYYSFQALNKRLQRGSSRIYNAILKYGYSHFSLDILEYCEPDKLIEKEQHYIDLLKPEYNILKTAYSRIGHKHTEKNRIKMSIIRKGYKHTDETIQKLKEINKTISLETKLKLSLRSKGVNVEVLDIITGFKYEFSSMTEAAQHINVTYQFISKIFNSMDWTYKNWILQFKLKDLKILVYNSNQTLINTFDSIKITSELLNIPKYTIRRYIKSGKLYKNKFYFYIDKSQFK